MAGTVVTERKVCLLLDTSTITGLRTSEESRLSDSSRAVIMLIILHDHQLHTTITCTNHPKD